VLPCGTNETASLIMHDKKIFLTKWPKVHDAVKQINLLYRRITYDDRKYMYTYHLTYEHKLFKAFPETKLNVYHKTTENIHDIVFY